MDNNTTQNYSYTNRNLKKGFQTNDFENLKLNEIPNQDLQNDNKGFQNGIAYTENDHYTKERRRSYTSVFDI